MTVHDLITQLRAADPQAKIILSVGASFWSDSRGPLTKVENDDKTGDIWLRCTEGGEAAL
jgi:hypothetical protein